MQKTINLSGGIVNQGNPLNLWRDPGAADQPRKNSRGRKCRSPRLPVDPLNPANKIKMAVSAYDGERMLTAKRGDPNVVGRNWRSGSLEFRTQRCVVDGCLVIDVEYAVVSDGFCQPMFVA